MHFPGYRQCQISLYRHLTTTLHTSCVVVSHSLASGPLRCGADAWGLVKGLYGVQGLYGDVVAFSTRSFVVFES